MGLLLSVNIYSQRLSHKTERQHRMGNLTSRWGIFMNTLSLLEPQQAAVGAGINYKIARRWDVSAEFNYLFEGFVQDLDDYTTNGGYRTIFTLKRFSKSRIFFYGIDARIKYFSFTDKRDFINPVTADTLFNLVHNASNTLIGAAAIVGLRIPISKNRKWALELNAGLGNKYRTVKRKNIPAGYEYDRGIIPVPKHYNIVTDQDISGPNNFYFPAGIRIMYLF